MRLRDMANLTGLVMELGFEPESSDLLASTAAGRPLVLGHSVRWTLAVRGRGGKQPAKGQQAALSWREGHTTISRGRCISLCKSESILNRLSCGFQSFPASHADCNSCSLSMKTGQMEATSWLKRWEKISIWKKSLETNYFKFHLCNSKVQSNYFWN